MSSEAWSVRELSEIVVGLDAGVSVNADDRSHGLNEVGVLKTSAVYGGVFKPGEHKAVWRTERRRVRTPVEADSIIVSRMNTPDLVGESAYVSAAWPDLYLPDRLWLLRFASRDVVSVRWLSFVLTGHSAKTHVKLNATGTSGSMKNLPQARFLEMTIQCPPVEEQHRIADGIETIDTAIRNSERVIAKLQQMKQGLLHDVLTQGIDENGRLRDLERQPEQFMDSPLGRIPAQWKVLSFGSTCSSSAFGPRFPGNLYAADGNLATLRTTDMDDEGNIDLTTMPLAKVPIASMQQHLLEPNDLVISRSGTCGVAAVFVGYQKPVVPGAFLIRFRLRGRDTSQYFRRYFNSLGRPRVAAQADGWHSAQPG